MNRYLYNARLFRNTLMVLLLGLMCFFASCKKFLDEKPDKTRANPNTLDDCQELLDNYSLMNSAFPIANEAASDNFWLTVSAWQSLDAKTRSFYTWEQNADPKINDWSEPYKIVFVANQVFEVLEKYGLQKEDAQRYKEIKGAASFFRAYAFYQLAQLFSPAYTSASASQPLGIALRLNPNIDEKGVRSTVGQTYEQVIKDFKVAIALLPQTFPVKQSRPYKAAAYGAMARTYLAMEEYEKAGLYADSALRINKDLLNYKTLSPLYQAPFARFNKEVAFQAVCIGNTIINSFFGLVDKDLYDSYENNDLRKTLFFTQKGSNPDTYGFMGSYDGNYYGAPFTGIANDELFLIRAESYARAGNVPDAMKYLNDLLVTRWKVDPVTQQTLYVNKTAANADAALRIILDERRKELICRGLRWSDLRRLNRDSRFQKELKRDLNGTVYTLPANDLRYTLLIPFDALNLTSMQQNPR